MTYRRIVFVLSAWAIPSCSIYDEDLLNEGRSNSLGGVAEGAADGGGGSVVVGGSPVSVGASANGSGGGESNNTTGGTSSGGSGGSPAGGSGGSTATGGVPSATGGSECASPSGKKGTSTFASSRLLDNFDIAWKKLGDGNIYTGLWFVAVDMKGNSISPSNSDWKYDKDVCSADADTSLHIQGTGYTGWGVSFDATMDATDGGTVNISAFDGVAFWARGDSSQVTITVTDGDGAKEKAVPKFIGTNWQEYKVKFPAGVNLSKVEVIHIGLGPSPSYDLWIDDVTFYAD